MDQKNHSAKAEQAKLWKNALLRDLEEKEKEKADGNETDKSKQIMNDVDDAVTEEKNRLLQMVCPSHSFVSECDVDAD